MTGFPRFRVDPSCAETNKPNESWEWELPKKTVKRDAVYRKEPDGCDTVKGIPTSDSKFNFLEEEGKGKGKQDNKNLVYPASINKELKEIRKESKLIVNLSSETLIEYEISLLKKRALNFVQQQRAFIKLILLGTSLVGLGIYG